MVSVPGFPPFTSFAWDEAKRLANLSKHGVDFASAEYFDFDGAIVRIDNRKDYGEVREVAIGFIGGRLHVLCFTRRAPELRIISLRKANEDEVNDYRTQKT